VACYGGHPCGTNEEFVFSKDQENKSNREDPFGIIDDENEPAHGLGSRHFVRVARSNVSAAKGADIGARSAFHDDVRRGEGTDQVTD